MRKSVTLALAGLTLALTGVAGPASVAGAASAAAGGPAWKVQATAAPPNGANGYLTGMACPAAGNCWAVGYRGNLQTGTPLHALAEHWNGTVWTLGSVLSPTARTTLFDVACTTGTNCEAVGSYTASSGTIKTLAEHWNGSAWAVQATPSPTGGGTLIWVTCVTAADCEAVGGSPLPASSRSVPLAEHWNGKTWTIQPTPKLQTGGILGGVSCPSATFCLAVGETLPTGNTYSFPLAERWNGKTWTAQKAANPGGKYGGGLFGLTCTSTTACTAVGQASADAGHSADALAERWNGTAWTAQNTHVSGASPELNAVACPSATNCTAVGDGPDGIDTLAMHWDGTSWSRESTPEPGIGSQLNDVTCTVTRCVAVGDVDRRRISQPLAETN